ncbi:class I SAM-dependent methyltransferase family protein [Natrialba sp. PRR66]|uniref:class I SAM-dependent methyltransferase n=1 Tax=Natrialba sp. PRR66 TaxID=3098146 RepID=UPI002B1D02CE|nr:class I SAM-dependent methyltransferase family protein [Natrialba sp. PRR66]
MTDDTPDDGPQNGDAGPQNGDTGPQNGDTGPQNGDTGERRTESALDPAAAEVLGRTTADAPLAAIVEKPRTETAIESLRAEGVYDDSRRVRETDAERIALPITEPPTETAVLDVVRQLDPEPRTTDLSDLLAERGWSEAALESIPNSWAVIGSVIQVSIPEGFPADRKQTRERELGNALLELHGEADSVIADEGIATEGEAGRMREPRTRHLAGERDTETIHAEHGTKYGLDPTEVMFSPGNQAERVRMGERCAPDEHVFDMFAGIGYFTLPMARAGARVTATEINPTAFRYLVENALLNDVSEHVDAYMTDCRDLAGEIDADRVVMGYYGSGGRSDEEPKTGTETEAEAEANAESEHELETEFETESDPEFTARTAAAHTFLDDALAALVPGGTLHYHEATPETLLWERPIQRVETAIDAAGRTLTELDHRRVKSHSAGVDHVVLDATVE